MSKFTFTKTFLSAFLLLSLAVGQVFAQGSPWNGSYGNEWLQGKYGQKWLRIGVKARGVQRVNLPAGFVDDANVGKLQLFYRGAEVAINKVSATQIEFFGVLNDGSSDALLYRPTSARVNTFYSFYSDEGSYFLTVGTTDGKRAQSAVVTSDGAVELTSHKYTGRVNANNWTGYSHATWDPFRPINKNSFLEDGETRVGNTLVTNETKPIFKFDLTMRKFTGNEMPTVRALVFGKENYFPNGANTRGVHLFVGKSTADADLRDAQTVSIDGFRPGSFEVVAQQTDLKPNNAGISLGFQLDSPKQGDYFDRFAISYYSITYNQEIDMGTSPVSTNYTFNFPAAQAGTKNRFKVKNPPTTAGTLRYYDVSDPANVRILNITDTYVTFNRVNDNPMSVFAVADNAVITTASVRDANFSQINRSDYDYMIVTNQTLESSAQAFADYRKNGAPGKKYKTGVFKIVDIYDQFNYGEPSPIAIRRFVDYITADGMKDRFLLLMGKSVTRNSRITKELPDEVPTWAFPGSDLLLVEGLQGTATDVPVIPVGRIPAINNSQAQYYLDKVKEYEAATTGTGWRKRVVHLSGGKTVGEIDDHAANLQNVSDKVTQGSFGGFVKAYVKPDPNVANYQMDDLYLQVNTLDKGGAGGVGMITYFGHSAPYQTDFNFGYVSDPAKNFDNKGKYPVMFYNGCDILNVFSGNFDETVNTSTSRPQSLDWLLAQNKGAIAVFGNSWSGYASSCNNYLKKVYTEFYDKPDAQRGTIGQIIKTIAQQTKDQAGFRVGFENARLALTYINDQAQVHQTVLLGDPALRILNVVEDGLPVELISFDAKLTSPNRVDVSWKTSSEVNNSHFIVERSYNAKNFEAIGRVEGKGDSNIEINYSFIDSKPLPGTSYYRLKQVDLATKGADGKTIAGKSVDSKVVSVYREGTSVLNVFPNPVIDLSQIELDVPVKVSTWDIIDTKGAVRKSGKGDKADFSGLATADYILKIVTENNDIYYRKVLKK